MSIIGILVHKQINKQAINHRDTVVRRQATLLIKQVQLKISDYYHPCMRVGNVFGHICLSVCLSVCPSVQAITFEPLHIKTSFLVCRYIFTISRSSLSIKVIGSRSYEKNNNFTYFNMLISVYGYRSLMMSRSHIKVKVTSRSK